MWIKLKMLPMYQYILLTYQLFGKMSMEVWYKENLRCSIMYIWLLYYQQYNFQCDEWIDGWHITLHCTHIGVINYGT